MTTGSGVGDAGVRTIRRALEVEIDQLLEVGTNNLFQIQVLVVISGEFGSLRWD